MIASLEQGRTLAELGGRTPRRRQQSVRSRFIPLQFWSCLWLAYKIDWRHRYIFSTRAARPEVRRAYTCKWYNWSFYIGNPEHFAIVKGPKASVSENSGSDWPRVQIRTTWYVRLCGKSNTKNSLWNLSVGENGPANFLFRLSGTSGDVYQFRGVFAMPFVNLRVLRGKRGLVTVSNPRQGA